MYHRLTWLESGNNIPEGYEIDHLCKNRACCNIEHLQCIPRDKHLKETNEQRYAVRQEEAKKYWEEHKTSGTKLADLFEVTFSTGCRWIRKWKLTC
jgi:hypothetical protein